MKEDFVYSKRQVETRHGDKEDHHSTATTLRVWRRLLSAAQQSIFAWQLVIREFVGAAIAWVAYALMNVIIGMPGTEGLLVAWIESSLPILFWITVVVSCGSIILASMKSALPAVIALSVSLILGLLGLSPWYLWMLLAANICTVLYAISFAYTVARSTGL